MDMIYLSQNMILFSSMCPNELRFASYNYYQIYYDVFLFENMKKKICCTNPTASVFSQSPAKTKLYCNMQNLFILG